MTEAANDTTQTSQSSSTQSSQQQSQAGGEQNGGSDRTQQAQAPARPEGLPDRFFDATAGVKFAELVPELNRLTAFEAEQNVRRASLPADPSAYKLELPAGFKMPDGQNWEWDENDPRLPEIRKLAHEAGLDQGQFARMLGVHVAYQMGEDQRIVAAKKAEIDKLGANGPARVDAVGTWLKAQIGEEKGAALLDRLVLATDLEAFEDLIKKSSNVVQFNGQHRERQTNALSEDQYNSMTPMERRAHLLKQQTAGR